MATSEPYKPFLSKSSTGPVVVRGGKIERASSDDDVDYELLSPSQFFGTHINTLPLLNNVQSARLFYANRFINQAVPLVHREAPLVQNLDETDEAGKSWDEKMGSLAGAKFADSDGVVEDVTDTGMRIKGPDGTVSELNFVNRMPLNRKTSWDFKPVVKKGDAVKKGQPLVVTNYTDDKGTMALGLNARIGLAAYKGFSYDDSAVISEAFAKKLASEHLYKEDIDWKDGVEGGKAKWLSLFPKTFKQEEVEHIEEDGVAKVGSIIQPGQPLILASKPKPISSTNRTLGKLHSTMKSPRSDASILWDGEEPAEVIDVKKTAKGVRMNVRTTYTVKEGDKIVTRNGHKGIVSLIIPNDQMPRTMDGEPFDMLVNQLGLPSRVNNAMPLELQLGKIAKKTGQPVKVPSFGTPGKSRTEEVKELLAQHGLTDKEEVFDPVANRKLENPITTGYGYVMKLHHMGSAKISHRGVGSYDQNRQPMKGSGEAAQAKRASGLEINAMQSAGAYNNVREFSTLRGQKNDQYWRDLSMGLTPKEPGKPFVWDKFKAILAGAGYNMRQIKSSNPRSDLEQLTPFTDADLDALKPIEVKNPGIVDLNDPEMKPVPEGLFDPAFLENGWGYIRLPHKMLNPAYEKAAISLLGLKKKDFDAIVAGEMDLPEHLR